MRQYFFRIFIEYLSPARLMNPIKFCRKLVLSSFFIFFQIGGATGHIGDPSERSTERPSLSSELVFKNADGIRENIENVFENFRRHFTEGAQYPPVK